MILDLLEKIVLILMIVFLLTVGFLGAAALIALHDTLLNLGFSEKELTIWDSTKPH